MLARLYEAAETATAGMRQIAADSMAWHSVHIGGM